MQNAYLQYKKESNVSYFDQCKFLSKTPRVDDLKIDPEPDIIIKTWFDDIISGMHRAFPTSEYSRHKVEAEFNSIEKQLEYEWNLWKEQQEKCGQGNAENKEQPREKAVHGNRDKNGDKLLKQPITLKSFIEIHCDLTAKPDVQSKVSLLHEYNRKQKIKLPRLAKRYKPGQHKYYYVEDLKKNWADYQREMPTLPPP